MHKGFILEGIGCLMMIVIVGMLFIPACCIAISEVSSRRTEKRTVTEMEMNGKTNIVTVTEYTYK